MNDLHQPEACGDALTDVAIIARALAGDAARAFSQGSRRPARRHAYV
jgi:hypothetical protein